MPVAPEAVDMVDAAELDALKKEQEALVQD
jgi:hypothetical protein